MVHLKPLTTLLICIDYVYVRPCTKYPTHGIKACVAKQGDTVALFVLITFLKYNSYKTELKKTIDDFETILVHQITKHNKPKMNTTNEERNVNFV
ncbi:hypothetical protein BpHYR1_018149 [Brachionus plicatilis]|uniref:Uncharacterized protein n=1 Tax=Brachionus plicatilis TaxID=10195 RepID=A0A3M7QC16_BRAPC|nr:hypothetical protein BpHYR1_018149 [Brachionus plicatilis]